MNCVSVGLTAFLLHTAFIFLAKKLILEFKINIEVTNNSQDSGSGSSRKDSGSSSSRKDSGSRRRSERDNSSDRKQSREKRGGGKNEDPFAKVRKKGRSASEERHSNKSENGKPEWAKFFEGQVKDIPFYNEFSKKKKKKK